ncbi:MAG: response regulator [Actinobacteria bacterium]|nr:response regulator [Actinomycetota bacterium]
MGSALRVLIVDDSGSTRAMLREALTMEGGIDVVGEARSGRQAVARSIELGPDVVLMDVRMADGNGAEACREITARRPDIQVVALTWSDDPATVRDMLSAGAAGYVVKGGTIDELVSAIRAAAGGRAELDRRVPPAALDDLRGLLELERSRREDLERLATDRAELVQVLLHEVRGPLTVISGALRMLRQGPTADAEELLVLALRRARDLEFLLEGLELVAAGSSEGEARPDRAMDEAIRRAGRSPDDLTVSDEVWEGVPERSLHRVAYELLVNALRHGSRPVRVKVRREGGHGVLVVTDAGGWSPPDEDFPAFRQDDMSATRSEGGWGLGLFLASRLCRVHDGRLSIENRDGSTVAEARFRLRPPGDRGKSTSAAGAASRAP